MVSGLQEMDSNGVAALSLMTGMTPTTHSKHISVRGKDQTIVEDWALIQKKDRTGRDGKNIKCPQCGGIQRVYHLSFSKIVCRKCRQDINKYEWMIDQLDTWQTPR